jgi:hypothetical protein
MSVDSNFHTDCYATIYVKEMSQRLASQSLYRHIDKKERERCNGNSRISTYTSDYIMVTVMYSTDLVLEGGVFRASCLYSKLSRMSLFPFSVNSESQKYSANLTANNKHFYTANIYKKICSHHSNCVRRSYFTIR